jgi:hypothetical protein
VPPSIGPLVTYQDVVEEVHRLFDAGPDSGLVIRVYGEEDGGPAADAAFREMLASLRMYDMRFSEGVTPKVEPPSRAALARAMSVLGREEHQRRILKHVLTTFGRRLINPLNDQLDPGPVGPLLSRLGMMRDMILANVAGIGLTPASQEELSTDLRRLLSDAYLAGIAEHEERVQRPRVTELARAVLRLIGGIFRGALQRWPDHADRIAGSITRRLTGAVPIGDVPLLLREHITAGIEEFLWVETSTEIEGALRSLYAEHRGTVRIEPAPLSREAYREFASACWKIIADNC